MTTTETRTLIAETFITLTQEMPLDKISVASIVERLNKNRKVFYYYFSSKEDLIRWVFRSDLAKLLIQGIPPEQLVYESDPKGRFAKYPFYVFMPRDHGTLDHSRFFYLFSQCIRHRQGFYKVVLSDEGPGSFEDYLFKLYYPQIKKDIIVLLGEKHLELTRLNFLAEFYTGGIIYLTKARLNNKVLSQPLVDISPFDNIIHESLSLMFKENSADLRTHY